MYGGQTRGEKENGWADRWRQARKPVCVWGKGTLLDEWTGDGANGKSDGQTDEHSLAKGHHRLETSVLLRLLGEHE